MTQASGYILGYDDGVVDKLAERTLEREGVFVKPWLQSGMRVLDAGCGPGSMTLGLADLVAPGMVTGVDMDGGQVARARGMAQQRGVVNVRFIEADIYRLPFEDASFDAIFCHTVFMHLARPEDALKQLYRVCKPGGLIAIREGLGMFDKLATVRMNGVERSFSELMRQISTLGDGVPNIGVELLGLLRAAGFYRVRPETHNEVYYKPVDLLMLRGWFLSMLRGALGERAVGAGLMTEAELGELMDRMRGWPADPAAMAVVCWVEVVGWRPSED